MHMVRTTGRRLGGVARQAGRSGSVDGSRTRQDGSAGGSSGRQHVGTSCRHVLAGSDRLAQVLAGWAEASGTSTQQGAGRDEAQIVCAW